MNSILQKLNEQKKHFKIKELTITAIRNEMFLKINEFQTNGFEREEVKVKGINNQINWKWIKLRTELIWMNWIWKGMNSMWNYF